MTRGCRIRWRPIPADADRLPGHAARERPERPALLFKGATLTWRGLARQSDACARRSDGARNSARRPDRATAAQLSAVRHRPVRRMEDRRDRRSAQPDLHGPGNRRPAPRHGIETIVTLTRYYARVKPLQGRTPLRHIIARTSRIISRRCCDGSSPWLASGATAIASTVGAGDHDFLRLLRAHRRRHPGPSRLSRRRSGRAAHERRDDRHAEGRARHARRVRDDGLQEKAWIGSVFSGDRDVILVPLPLFHVYANVGIQGLALINGSPLALVPNPRDLGDLLATIRRVKPAFFNGVPTLYIALLNHPDVQKGKVDFKSIKICFSGIVAAARGHETAVRIADRGPHRRGLFADGSDDGAVREPGERSEQAGIGRHAAAGRARADLRRRAKTVRRPGRVGEIAFCAPQLMVGFWNRPDETAGGASRARRERRRPALVAHRRSRLSGRGRIPLHRRSAEGSDQDERLPGLAARNRGSGRVTSRQSPRSASPAWRTRSRAKRWRVDCLAGRPASDEGIAGFLPPAPRAVQGPVTRRVSHRVCPRQWSAKCCDAR